MAPKEHKVVLSDKRILTNTRGESDLVLPPGICLDIIFRDGPKYHLELHRGILQALDHPVF